MSLLDDLSGVELRRRLEQREYPEPFVEQLVEHRDWCPECRKFLLIELGLI